MPDLRSSLPPSLPSLSLPGLPFELLLAAGCCRCTLGLGEQAPVLTSRAATALPKRRPARPCRQVELCSCCHAQQGLPASSQGQQTPACMGNFSHTQDEVLVLPCASLRFRLTSTRLIVCRMAYLQYCSWAPHSAEHCLTGAQHSLAQALQGCQSAG